MRSNTVIYKCKFGRRVGGGCKKDCKVHHICILNVGAAHHVFEIVKLKKRLNKIQKLILKQLTLKLHDAAKRELQVVNFNTDLMMTINENLTKILTDFEHDGETYYAYETTGAFLVPKNVYSCV